MGKVQGRSGKPWRRKKEKHAERQETKKIKLRVCTLSVGTMTDKGKDIADPVVRKGMVALCGQKPWSKRAKYRCVGRGYTIKNPIVGAETIRIE